MTKRLYYDNQYLTDFRATVVSSETINGKNLAVLDKTAFFPTGGGQPCDLGTLDGITVVDVYEKDGIIYHETALPLEKSTEVNGKIDWARRFMLMQNHSGEHILSGVAHARHGCNNVGFHMGEDFITVDFDKPLTAEQLSSLEDRVNEMITQNLEIIAKFPSSEELSEMEYRSKKELSGDVRIIEVPGADLCACCGLHVARTGEIGLMKIVEHINYKGGVRLSILSGKRAFDDYKRKNVDIYDLSALLSRKPTEILDGVKRLYGENESKKVAVDALWRKYVDEKTGNIPESTDIIFIKEDGCDNMSLRVLALAAAKKCRAAVAYSNDENGLSRFVIASEKEDTRPLCRELCEKYGGKGGGKAEVCQGTAKTFAETER